MRKKGFPDPTPMCLPTPLGLVGDFTHHYTQKRASESRNKRRMRF